MPIYEYKCQVCHHQLEAFQKMSDSPLTDCPKCGKSSLEKVVSSTQFQLKGTGWYVTDFKNSGKEKKKTTTTTTDDSSASTEKKPASSSDSK